MAKNGKMKFVWISLATLAITILAILVPWLYGAGKAQANLVSTDVALAKADAALAKDIDELEEDGCSPAKKHKVSMAVLEQKFDGYHTEQMTANKNLMDAIKAK